MVRLLYVIKKCFPSVPSVLSVPSVCGISLPRYLPNVSPNDSLTHSVRKVLLEKLNISNSFLDYSYFAQRFCYQNGGDFIMINNSQKLLLETPAGTYASLGEPVFSYVSRN